MIAGAIRSLPTGLPKLLVSTMASGNVGGYIGTRDMCIMHSVTDIAGLNRISRKILTNAALAIAGMAKGAVKEPEKGNKSLIAITMYGWRDFFAQYPCLIPFVTATRTGARAELACGVEGPVISGLYSRL